MFVEVVAKYSPPLQLSPICWHGNHTNERLSHAQGKLFLQHYVHVISLEGIYSLTAHFSNTCLTLFLVTVRSTWRAGSVCSAAQRVATGCDIIFVAMTSQCHHLLLFNAHPHHGILAFSR